MDKAHILKEILRVSKTMEGKPLGRGAFERETGIRESEWHGKYWTKWGDALEEAGLSKNSFQSAYEMSFLCQKYAELVREVSHVPVEAELKIKARADSSFPSHTTLARLGKKRERLAHVVEFCESNPGFEDVLAICKSGISDSQSIKKEVGDANIEGDGYVYLIKSGRHYKIGCTKDFHRRGREIAIELPERADTIHVIRTDDPFGIEAYWHKRFKDRQGNGEWFSLTLTDVKAFKRRKFM